MLQDSLKFSTCPASDTWRKTSKDVLIYLIPGNPGLIEYYREFLAGLAERLGQQEQDARYIVTGCSLPGFELSNELPDSVKSPPYTLNAQVTNVHEQIDAAAADARAEIALETGEPDHRKLPVILMGHSVGAYILLETISQRQRVQQEGFQNDDDSDYEIIGGINLFPTVVDIAKSKNGRMAAPLTIIPGFAWIVSALARLLCWLISTSALLAAVQYVTKMPEQPAKATTAFLRSRHGVYQALYMARYELLEITCDKWTNELWGDKGQLSPTYNVKQPESEIDRPQLYFYWGEKDHWVGDSPRDDLIATRARQVGKRGDEAKPHMQIDRLGIPHAFCIRHSKPVAEVVAGYVDELMAKR